MWSRLPSGHPGVGRGLLWPQIRFAAPAITRYWYGLPACVVFPKLVMISATNSMALSHINIFSVSWIKFEIVYLLHIWDFDSLSVQNRFEEWAAIWIRY
jgi:hypothetical protein